MTINLNGENVDYELEYENNLGDVVDSIDTWLKECNMVLSTIRINGQQTAFDDDSWRRKRIKDTQDLNITALKLNEARYVQFKTGRDFFNLVSLTARKRDFQSLKDFTPSWQEVQDHILRLLKENSSQVKEIFQGIEDSGFPLDEKPNTDKLSQLSSSLYQLLSQRCEEFEKPYEIALETANRLASYAENLEEVGINFQTGKDKEAIDIIIYLTEQLQILIRCLRLVDFDSACLASFNDKLQLRLKELENALEVSDTVQIGDLLEYEIKPILISLPSEINSRK